MTNRSANNRERRTSLTELRKRTDLQLGLLIDSEMDRAIELAQDNRIAEARARLKVAMDLLSVATVPEKQLADINAKIYVLEAALEYPRFARAAS